MAEAEGLQCEHRCKLKQRKGPVINYFIDTGVLIRLRRRLKLSMMLSESHPRCEEAYKSWQVVRSEQIRHLTAYHSTIHPFSSFQMYWEYIICSTLLFSTVIMSINSAYSWCTRKGDLLLILESTCDTIITTDIVKQFVTGYYDVERNNSVLRKSSIAKKYILTYFFPDVLSCVHTYLIPFRFIPGISTACPYMKFHKFSRIFAGFRIVRFPRMLTAFRLFARKANMKKLNAKILEYLLILVMVFSWLYFIQFSIENFIEYKTSDRVRWKIVTWDRFYSATLLLMKVGVSESLDRSDHVASVMIASQSLVIGWILDICLMALALQLWKQYSSGMNSNDVVRKQFMHYVSYKRLPPTLRKKVFEFYDFKIRNGVYREHRIYNNASLILQQQIQVYTTRYHIARVEFFHILPESLLLTLSNKLKTEVYLTNDVIVSTGEIGLNMYFINYGTVAVYTPSGKEMCHLDDGAHFGEISILFKERRLGSVLAATPCELFALSKSDFEKLLAPYPEIENRIKDLARDRYMVLNKVIYDRIRELNAKQ
ncbi:unnamed protein product [Callosobruchus maculatus]|uniref:Cyclic nucleotide-binding domain-containing protein n=1 Tax=Callosobruchus maculatus TaxID=64391 RepID=A0A653BX76_CALMS|nr:unnamed protein product [Callosobruchus maculatus]